jgi:hypothetical protein
MGDIQKDAFDYQLDMLKNEFNSVQECINHINTIMQAIKNWTITIWSGSIALFLIKSQYDLKKYIIFTCIIPLLFWFLDTVWRRHQRLMIYRINTISKFLNSNDFQESFNQRKFINFHVIDIRASNEQDSQECKQFASFWRIFNFNSIRLFYGGLLLISLGLGAFFIIN